MKIQMTRRGFLARLGGGAMALAALSTGWLRRSAPVQAAVRWRMLVPFTSDVGILNFHGSGTAAHNALDFFRPHADSAKALTYIVMNDGTPGWFGVISINNSCSTAVNTAQRCVNFNIATDTFVLISIGIACHIVPTVAVNDLVGGNGGTLGVNQGANSLVECYDATHIHWGAQDMTGVGQWANTAVTGGFHAPWEKFV